MTRILLVFGVLVFAPGVAFSMLAKAEWRCDIL